MYYTLPACITLNDAGDLVPDPECFRSQTAVIPNASPSIQPQTTESEGSILVIALPILVVLIIVISICLIVMLLVYMKHRRKRRVVKMSTSFAR